MFRRHDPEPAPAVAEQDAVLLAEPDPDPFVQGAVERMVEQLRHLDAVDQWGRPVSLRQVARIALGELASPRVRDVVTAERLETALSTSPEGTDRTEAWRSFFKGVEDSDRLLRDQPSSLPEA